MNYSSKNKKNNIKIKKIKKNKSIIDSSNNINSIKNKNKKIQKKIFNLNQKILDIKKKIKEAPLRLLATIENTKKEKKKANQLIKEEKIINFFKKFIIILQNINKILSSFIKLKNIDNSEFQGISLIKKSIIEVLKKNNIQKIGKIGEKYNSNIHKIKNKNKIKKNKSYIIKNIIYSGYILNKRILKRAIVKI